MWKDKKGGHALTSKGGMPLHIVSEEKYVRILPYTNISKHFHKILEELRRNYPV